MTAAEITEKFEGYLIELHYDEDCFSPRDDDGNVGLFLGLPHRHYKIGDEQIDPDLTVACDCIEGDGEPFADCNKCSGEGEIGARNLTELRDLLQAKYQARVILPVGMIDHSGVSYYIGGGAHWCDPGGWDSGTCGFILTTPATIARFGGEGVTDEELEQWLTSEIEEYDRWARGDCYGYVITDPDGEEIDESCWGLIGGEYAMETAKEVVSWHKGKVHAERAALYKRLVEVKR